MNLDGTMAPDDQEGSADELTIYADDEQKFFAQMRSMNNDDAMTVATSAVDAISVYSGVPTSYFSKKCMEFNDKLNAEKTKRAALEQQINNIKDDLITSNKLVNMNLQNPDHSEKLKLMDQRNCMQTGQNYTTHPQTEHL